MLIIIAYFIFILLLPCKCEYWPDVWNVINSQDPATLIEVHDSAKVTKNSPWEIILMPIFLFYLRVLKANVAERTFFYLRKMNLAFLIGNIWINKSI